ncbi:MAG: TetR/AcrR family transcriptional regulator [Actinomycetia bacterium]|nr:TetR/AcrR family transcriptional regulator [Actinomycetes bacterium]
MGSRQAITEVRTALLDAARELIAEIGYEKMSHADITAEVGIGRTTFYEHFSSKEDVLVELVRRDLPPLSEAIVDAVDPDLPPAQRLEALTYRMVEFVGTDHVGLILHTEVPRLSPEAQRGITEAHKGIASEFSGVYRQGVASGVFRSIPPRLVGRMMDQIIMAGGKAVMESNNPSKDVDEIARETALMLVAALRADPES